VLLSISFSLLHGLSLCNFVSLINDCLPCTCFHTWGSTYLFSLNQDGHTQEGKRLYVPRVEDKNSHMRMLNISCIDDLVANSMNILEPAPVDSDGNERENGNFVCYI
jgi:hypothetical protein